MLRVWHGYAGVSVIKFMRGRKVSGLTAETRICQNMLVVVKCVSPPPPPPPIIYAVIAAITSPVFAINFFSSSFSRCLSNPAYPLDGRFVYTKIIVKLGGKVVENNFFLFPTFLATRVKIGQNLKRSSDNFSTSENRRNEFMRKRKERGESVVFPCQRWILHLKIKTYSRGNEGIGRREIKWYWFTDRHLANSRKFIDRG